MNDSSRGATLGDVCLEALKKWSWMLPCALGIGTVVVAFAVHTVAQPGTQVALLWGLIEYTKQSPTPNEAIKPVNGSSITHIEAPAPKAADKRVAIAMSVSHGMDAENYPTSAKELRKEHSLRELRAIESGRPLEDIDTGTYFFVVAPIWQNLVLRRNLGPHIAGPNVNRYDDAYWMSYEVQRRASGEHLFIGFASESDADRVRKLPGDKSFDLTVVPRPWGLFSSRLEIPLDRIDSFKDHVMEDGPRDRISGLDISIR